ncbi:hypothetical protein [Pseudonocardia sp. HH130630-07]|uniref:hypothetical protein n=1 Tax=Pseudonocardia sp. HH130630-07 TaxID=1690815 RepID=UPI0008153120|nr:hypothetical protein [Pseudonocardia sp. HH130630-07]ANY05675.1 hypothetical protein AFB00_04425 [Pseudonocardia sp. HH130630-07]
MSDDRTPTGDPGRTDGTVGSEVGTGELTYGGAGTVRDERDHSGNPRSPATTDDSGATAAAAREVATDHDDEPTRSE